MCGWLFKNDSLREGHAAEIDKISIFETCPVAMICRDLATIADILTQCVTDTITIKEGNSMGDKTEYQAAEVVSMAREGINAAGVSMDDAVTAVTAATSPQYRIDPVEIERVRMIYRLRRYMPLHLARWVADHTPPALLPRWALAYFTSLVSVARRSVKNCWRSK